MECNDSMINWNAIRRGLAALGLGIAASLWAAEPELVIVANENSPIQFVSATEARRIFLGVPVAIGGKAIVPILNNTSALVQEIFLQKIVFMSAPAYERRMVAKHYRDGGDLPQAIADHQQLVDTLVADTARVSYMLREAIAATPQLKIVGEP